MPLREHHEFDGHTLRRLASTTQPPLRSTKLCAILDCTLDEVGRYVPDQTLTAAERFCGGFL